MVIEEPDFRLTQVSPDSIFWDLELLHVIRPKNKEPRTEFKVVAYGLTLPTAMKKIINYRINVRHAKEDAIKMKDYIKDFIDYSKKLEYIFNYYNHESKEKQSKESL